MTRTISIPMNWQTNLPLLLAVLTDGNATGQAMAREELARMAKVADLAPLYRDRARLVRKGAQFARELVRIVELPQSQFNERHAQWRADLEAHKVAIREYWHARKFANTLRVVV